MGQITREESQLILVPTPIGNLGDITLRALEVLKSVDVILAEDTRITKKLLAHFEIQTPLRAYHQHNEHKVTESILREVSAGTRMAMVTDAGTPGISDPGFLLIREAVQAGIRTECLPGATAFVPALVNSGLTNDRFVFEGFLPHKKGRQTRLKAIAEETRTSILYESPHRLVKCLRQLAEFCGEDRQVSVSRELTKLHEETKRGTLNEVADHFDNGSVKGECVIILQGVS